MVHGWRLDPILLFSQVLIVTVLVAGWENIIKRFNCQHGKIKKKKRKIVFFLLNIILVSSL
jgi:hypothetical protein